MLPVMSELGINISSVIRISSENYKPLETYLEATTLQGASLLSPEGNLVIEQNLGRKETIFFYLSKDCSFCGFLPLYALCLCRLPVSSSVCNAKTVFPVADHQIK